MDAPPAVVWDVVSDHGLYAEAAPNLETVEVVEGEGAGLVRRCVDTDGNEWTERCTRWDDGSGFAVSVDVERSEFHRRLFHRFEGEWSVAPADDGVVVTVAFDFEPRFGPLGRLIGWYLGSRAPGLVEAIFDRWEAEIDARVAAGPTTEHGTRRTNALYR